MIPLSEGTAIAIHAMIYLASRPDSPHSLKDVAAQFAISENHLSKVLQKLVKAEFLVSVKGPKGGYRVHPAKRSATLLEVYEVMEGKFQPKTCLFGGVRTTPCCCAMRPMINAIHRTFLDFMSSHTIDNIPIPERGDSSNVLLSVRTDD